MRFILQSARDSAFIALEPLPDIDGKYCDVTASLGGHTQNDSLPLLRLAEFCVALRTFIETGEGEARLDGAYDFHLVLRPYPARAEVWVQFYLAKYILQEDGDYGRLALSGGFGASREAVRVFAASFLAFYSDATFPEP